jgi:UDP-glucose 4-epimerase
MRVLVTGASGFLGHAILPALRAAGHEVRAPARADTGDLAGTVEWTRHVEGVDAVVHLAALAHARGVDSARLRAVNVDATLALGRAALAEGARLVFMSSSKVLGEESGAAPLAGDGPMRPQDAYARAKAEAETGLRALPGLALTVLRPPLVYGEGVKANFLALMRAVARGVPLPLAAIDNRRSLVYVGNLAEAVARCLVAPAAAGRTYAVTDGAARSTPELCRALGEALGRPARLFPVPPALLEIVPAARKLTRSMELDDAALRRELGWAPPVAAAEALARTAAWFRASVG